MFQDEENPLSADTGLNINRVINRSITHSEEESGHRHQTWVQIEREREELKYNKVLVPEQNLGARSFS